MDHESIITNNVAVDNDNIEQTPPTTTEKHQSSTTEQKTETLIEETTHVLEKLKEVTATSSSEQNSIDHEKKVEENKRKVESVKNPFKNLTPRVTQLIYWENPIHSGALLATGLTFLIFTTYYSLFNTICALAFILIGANWVYVIGWKQIQSLINQKPINPHEHLLLNKPWYIEREDAEKYLDVTIEAINFVLLEAQRIVLVDDPMRTIKHILAFYVLWTLGTWMSPRTLLGIVLVLGFVIPIAYQKNKVLVDEKLDKAKKFLHSYFDRGLNIAKQHTGGVYEKAKSFATKKGYLSDTNSTKKEE
ncbi:Reticulon-domain-containing protein [Glomus cerebriforme]|uniref:Reticulon-like protein n=1 Tax=Glomus cerebriforme TaxID=658196 RepID=A0A397S8H8_9GLOM|nr:Reticulon-domain-containing protein [Glomus cerebriforme]